MRRLISVACLLASWGGVAGETQKPGLIDLPFADLLQTRIGSGTKRADEIRDIPASVTILTREEIERYGYVTFDHLLANLPGLFLIDTTSERLLGSRGPIGGGVLLLINGVPQHQVTLPAGAQYNIPVESIDRIEVIRGPMSIIYGNNAFVGVINVVSNEIERHGPRVSASAGTGRSGRLFARIGQARDEGFWVLNAGAYRTDGLQGDYADMLGPAQLAQRSPAMHQDMAGDIDRQEPSLDLCAGWGGWRLDLRYNQRTFGFYFFSPPFDNGSRAELASWQGALSWDHRFAENLALRLSGVHSEEDFDVGEYDFLTPEINGFQRQSARRTDLELDLFYDPLPNLNLLAGYRLRALSGGDNRVVVSPGILDRWRQVDGVILHDLFAELGWNPSETLRLVGGLRYSRLPPAYGYTETDYLTGIQTRQRIAPQEPDSITGRIAALWSLDRQRTVKLIWGAAAQDNYRGTFPEPEQIETIELNYLETRRDWTLAAGVFRNRVSQIVRSIKQIDPATGTYTQFDDNSGRWHTLGLELDAEAQPLPGLRLGLSAVWQHTDDVQTGIAPGYSPALLLKLKADYRRGPITYGVYAHFVGEMQTDWDFQNGASMDIRRIGDTVPGYWNLGLNLRYDHPGAGLYANLNISNLLDAEIRYPTTDAVNLERGLIGMGRVITATLGWRF